VRGPRSAAAGIERTGFQAFLGSSSVGWTAYLAAPARLVPGNGGSAPVDPVVDAVSPLLIRFWPTVTSDPVGWGLPFAGGALATLVAWTRRDTLRGAV
jgi:hypothetical protein